MKISRKKFFANHRLPADNLAFGETILDWLKSYESYYLCFKIDTKKYYFIERWKLLSMSEDEKDKLIEEIYQFDKNYEKQQLYRLIDRFSKKDLLSNIEEIGSLANWIDEYLKRKKQILEKYDKKWIKKDTVIEFLEDFTIWSQLAIQEIRAVYFIEKRRKEK